MQKSAAKQSYNSMSWWLYIAYKQLFPTGKKISFFAAVSILGVALGVLALLGTQSVMNGFHEQIGQKLKDTTGDISVSRIGGNLHNTKELKKRLSKTDGVLRAEEVVQGPVMMIFRNSPLFPVFRSFDTISKDCALPVVENDFVMYNTIDALDDDGVILGSRMAYNAGISVGDFVTVYSPAMIDKLNDNEVPMPVRLKVVGLLNTGFSQADSNTGLVSLRRMRELYNFDSNGAQNISLKLKDGFDCKKFAKKLNGELDTEGLRAKSWADNNEAFLRVIYMEKTMMSLIIMLVILVASFSICISLYTSVVRKTREIGLMAAMGARSYQTVLCYCAQGLFIGILGSALGLALTFGILHFRQQIVDFTLGNETISEFYFLTRLPVAYKMSDIVSTSAFAVVLCTLAGVIPACVAARLKASKAMRNE